MLDRFARDTSAASVERLAASLGVSQGSLSRLGIVWVAARHVWGFPMRDAAQRVIGIRLRTNGGFKFAVTGSHNGLFWPEDLTGAGPLLICEGPTDTAALLDLGYDAIGRPSCAGAAEMVIAVVQCLHRQHVVAARMVGRSSFACSVVTTSAATPCFSTAMPPSMKFQPHSSPHARGMRIRRTTLPVARSVTTTLRSTWVASQSSHRMRYSRRFFMASSFLLLSVQGQDGARRVAAAPGFVSDRPADLRAGRPVDAGQPPPPEPLDAAAEAGPRRQPFVGLWSRLHRVSFRVRHSM